MNKLITLIFIFTTLTSFVREEECKNLPDGLYKVKYKTKGYEKEDFELLINKNNYTRVESNGKSTTGQIDWIGQCSFSLELNSMDTLANPDTSRPLSEDSISKTPKPLISPVKEKDLSVLLGQGRIYYEIDRKSEDRYDFRMTSTARPHVTLAEGQVIRLRN